MLYVTGLTLFLCLSGPVNGMINRQYIKSGNISKSTWEGSIVLKKQTPSSMTCSMSCNQAEDTCNSASFDAVTKMCTHAKVEYLEDVTDDDYVSFFIDKEAANSLDQRCKGAYSCCSKAQRGLPCQLGEGDCRIDSDCKPGLFCTQGSCANKFGHSGGLWDEEDSCCENICSPERKCSTGEGFCESAADCLTAPGDIDAVCVQCTNTSMFPPAQYPNMSIFNYTADTKCCLSRGIQHIKSFDCAVDWLGNFYAFRGNMFWKITENNGFTAMYPKLISTTWIGLPFSGIDASFTKNNVTYFFKGSQLYAYSQLYTILAGYPMNMADKFQGLAGISSIDAATAKYGTTSSYLFSGAIYWKYDDDIFTLSDSTLYPRNINVWSQPASIEAVLHDGSYYFFFKGGIVTKQNQTAVFGSQDVANSWLKTV